MKQMSYLLALATTILVSACNKGPDPGAGGSADSQSYSSGNSRSSAANSVSNEANTQPGSTTAESSRSDNTARNVRDRNDATLTPGDQGGSESDREVTRRIRRAVTSNDRFSADAKNIKIITTNGKVTLRGPVNSEEEKNSIASLAKQNGAAEVDDQLEVSASTQK